MDEYITEAVLAKLEERTVTAPEVGPWAGASDLQETEEQLRELRRHWHMKKISNPLFFAEAERLEAEIARLTTERERHSVAVQRAQADITDVRRRWFSETDDDRLDMSQKRAYVQAFHAIIVHPMGQGNGSRSTFDHSKPEPIWRA